jgi:photosystem II stability/assembly factor-like uncharacterized protein
MIKIEVNLWFVGFLFISSVIQAQWTSVLDNVTPVQVAVSPDYYNDQTLYVVDDEERLLISESGGASWVTLYEAAEPGNPSQMILKVLLSPNFRDDNAIAMIHKDGTMKLSINRGNTWLTALTPDGITDLVFSPGFADDFTMYCITGITGPVRFYKTVNAGMNWGDPVANLTNDGGFYCRLWNSPDMASKDTFALQYENSSFYMSFQGGQTWFNSFTPQVSVSDFVFSPQFSKDSTVFIADAADIYKNSNRGDELSWENKANFPEAFGIRFAISPDFLTDHTIFAAVDHIGIVRSTDTGETWTPFNDGFTSNLPISIAISNAYPYTLFAGTRGTDGAPDKVWKYQSYTGVEEPGQPVLFELSCHPNPFSNETILTIVNFEPRLLNLSIFNITGNLVCVVYEGLLDKGTSQVRFDKSSHHIGPGIYVARLSAGARCIEKKLIIF